MENESEFLKEGEQTKITEAVRRVSGSIPGEGFEYVLNLLSWLQKNLEYKPHDPKLFRKRTASQILEDGFATGCTDYGLAFAALARAKKIPTTYIEALENRWLKEGGSTIHGHVFASIFVNEKWYLTDPTRGTISVSDRLSHEKYVVLGKGLDSWDIGIKDIEDLKEKAESLRNKLPKI